MPIRHVIEQGETTAGLATQHGLFAETVWNDGANAALKEKRKDMNVLLPGDVLVIPDKRLKEVDKPDAKKHRFKKKGIPAVFRLQLFLSDKPRKGEKYRLYIDGVEQKGSTDGDGVLEAFVSPEAREGRLVMESDGAEYLLAFGHMDPVDEVVGVQKRLSNLGLYGGPFSGELDDLTRSAIREFQARFRLQETGEPDAATKKKLEEIQDQPSAPLPPLPPPNSTS